MIRSILKAAHLKQYRPYHSGPTHAQDGPIQTDMQVLLAPGDAWIPNAVETKSVIK